MYELSSPVYVARVFAFGLARGKRGRAFLILAIRPRRHQLREQHINRKNHRRTFTLKTFSF